MGHNHDYWEGLRGYVIPKLGKYIQSLEAFGLPLYVESEARANQFVGRIEMGEEDFEKVLHDLGFERNPLSLLKSRFGEVEEGSFRKIYPHDHPEYQLHLIIYDGSDIDNAQTGELFLYAHWEYRWDVYPIKHYLTKNFDAGEGVSRVKTMLQDEGIEYEYIQP